MFYYQAYGLRICSEIPVPEFEAREEGETDVEIRYGDLDAHKPKIEVDDAHWIRYGGEEMYYAVRGAGAVLISEGRRIVVDPLPGAEEKGFRFILSGIVFGLLLHQRGAMTLHASAVLIDGGVAAFVGQKGAGKSTTAAAFLNQGHPLVTDDLLVVDLCGGAVRTRLGFPNLKLWPDAIDACFNDEVGHWSRIHPAGKYAFSASTEMPDEPNQLKCVYVLSNSRGSNETTTIEPLTRREAFVELLRHSYALRLLGEKGNSPGYLRKCAEVTRHVPVRTVRREDSLSRLPNLVKQVRQDFSLCSFGAQT